MNLAERLYNWLLYLTNNEDIPKKQWRESEIKFDIGFMLTLFLSIFLALTSWIIGVLLKFIALFQNNHTMSEIGTILLEGGWIFVAVVFFIEAYDSLRHNRTWDD